MKSTYAELVVERDANDFEIRELRDSIKALEEVRSSLNNKIEELGVRCTNCDSKKVVEISAKVSDLCYIKWYKGKNGRHKEQRGHVPTVLGLGDDHDYIDMDLCLNCGQVQNYESGV